MTKVFDDIARKKMLDGWSSKQFKYDGTPIKNMVVRSIGIETARKYISTFHYSKTMPDSTVIAFAGYLNENLCGIIVYGMGCGKNQYTAIIPDIQNGSYLELTRLWCVNDCPKNTESKLISESLKMLPENIKLVISFADENQGHCGIIYQATNWYYLGQNNGGGMLVCEDGIKKHMRLLGIYRMRHPEYKDLTNEELMDLLHLKKCDGGRKFRYVYLRGTKKEKKEMYAQIKDRIQPYPKIDKKIGKTDEELITEVETDEQQLNMFDLI